MITLLSLALAAPPAAHVALAETVVADVERGGYRAILPHLDLAPVCEAFVPDDLEDATVEDCTADLWRDLQGSWPGKDPFFRQVRLVRTFVEDDVTVATFRARVGEGFEFGELYIADRRGAPWVVEYRGYGTGQLAVDALVQRARYPKRHRYDEATYEASSLFAAHRYEEAWAVLDALPRRAFRDTPTAVLQAELALYLPGEERLDPLLARLRKALPDDPVRHRVEMEVAFRLGRIDDAFAAIAALESRVGPDGAFALMRSQLYGHQGRLDDQLAETRAIYALDPRMDEGVILPVLLAEESRDADTMLDVLLWLLGEDELAYPNHLGGVEGQDWFAELPQHDRWRAASRAHHGLPEAVPTPPEDRPLPVIGEDDQAVLGFLLDDQVLVSTHSGARGSGWLEVAGAAPAAERCDADIAVRRFSEVGPAMSWGDPVTEPGTEIWVEAPHRAARLAQLDGSRNGCLLYRFEEAFDASALRGAPLLDAEGRVVGMHVGAFVEGYVTWGFAIPVETLRPKVEATVADAL
jgi:hypothetical protein